MKKKYVLIFLVFFIIGGAAFYYFNYHQNTKSSIEQVIPDDALAMWSSQNFFQDLDNYKQSDFGKYLLQFEALNSFFAEWDNFLKVCECKNKPLETFISAHISSQKDLDLVYYLKGSSKKIANDFLNIISKKDGHALKNRVLDGFKIYEVEKEKSVIYSYVELENILVLSKSPILIEAVVKAYKTPKRWESLNNKIIINNLQLLKFASFYLNEKIVKNIFPISGDGIWELDAKIMDGVLNLSAFVSDSSLKPLNFDISEIKNFIPLSTVAVRQFNLNSKTQAEVVFKPDFNGDLSTLFITKFDDNESKEVVDTIFLESDYNVFKRDSLYAVEWGEFIFSAHEVSHLRYIFKKIEEENVWGKSVRINEKLENAVSGTSLNYFLNFKITMNYIFENLNDDFKEAFKSHTNQISSIDFMGIQYTSNIDKKALVESYLSFSESKKTDEIKPEKTNQSSSAFEVLYKHNHPISSKIYLVKNHSNASTEYIFQDTLNQINLVSADGKLLWSMNVDGNLISEIFQVDIFRNKKLQYAFCTENQFFVIDRNGENVEGFPKLFDYKASFFNVFDYDNNKNYRFAVSSEKGDLFIYDNKGIALKEWSPVRLGESLVEKPIHLRIAGKDIIVCAAQSGKIFAMNRKAEFYKGFPIKVNHNAKGGIFVGISNSLNTTNIFVLSDERELSKLNLSGQVVPSENIPIYGRSSILKDNLKKYIFTSKDDLAFRFYDSEFNEIFSLDAEPFHLQLHNLSESKKIIHYNLSDKSFLIDKKANELAQFDASQKLTLKYLEAKDKLQIYYSFNEEIRKLELKY